MIGCVVATVPDMREVALSDWLCGGHSGMAPAMPMCPSTPPRETAPPSPPVSAQHPSHPDAYFRVGPQAPHPDTSGVCNPNKKVILLNIMWLITCHTETL